ncbi:MAG: radical SAM protein, partial [Clostridia bacterium]|nr:radical SAM protein [Clostridia bacterium]
MPKCELCPRKCGIDRDKDSGFCGAKTLKIAKVMRHFWEEPIISGKNGSGAIFFSHCSLKCCYCQNYKISHEGLGKEISINELADIFKLIEKSGVENINLVSPTHYTNEIIEALRIYKPKIPIVWNTSGYENVETIKKLRNYIDVYLCDFKYFDNELAYKYSSAKDYFEACTSSLLQMRKNQPQDIVENDMMKKGIIIRHLILPTHTDDSIKIFDWIKSNLGNKVFISLMNQYLPCFKAKNYKELRNKIKPLEYKRVITAVQDMGFENGFLQEKSSSCSDFIP